MFYCECLCCVQSGREGGRDREVLRLSGQRDGRSDPPELAGDETAVFSFRFSSYFQYYVVHIII